MRHKMSLLIKLTEVFSKSSEYDPELRHVRQEHSLRELYVNPEHVVYAKEDEEYNDKLTRGDLGLGLNENTSFTKLAMNTSGQSAKMVTVVGRPDQIIEKFSSGRRREG
tara:strand:+ start:2193 stop:2519 length:327 start_codon:yes stop_codon:yes gene_type:complete